MAAITQAGRIPLLVGGTLLYFKVLMSGLTQLPSADASVRAALLARATVFTDEVAQSVGIGEAQHAIASGLVEKTDVNELGAVINGDHPGRTSADEITLFDGTGVGLQDLAVAARVVDLAVEKGVAVEVEF